MDYKSIFISDIHLGSKACKATELCKFLKENNCETLYLVGDIIDGWKLSRGWHFPQEHSNVIRRILTKAKRGTTIVYVIGNHDEFIRPWLKLVKNVGNIILTDQIIHTDTKGRKFLVTHGDLFDQVTRHWKWVSILGDRAYSGLLICNNILAKIRQHLGFGYWSLSKYLKSKTKQAINFIYKFEEHLSIYAKSKNMHGVICGHIHKLEIKNINGIVYINSGDWVETCSVIVEHYDGTLEALALGIDGRMISIKTYQ
jgi:UDP-2,3-diacylglucosamine pyrophosphatase LpxH